MNIYRVLQHYEEGGHGLNHGTFLYRQKAEERLKLEEEFYQRQCEKVDVVPTSTFSLEIIEVDTDE